MNDQTAANDGTLVERGKGIDSPAGIVGCVVAEMSTRSSRVASPGKVYSWI